MIRWAIVGVILFGCADYETVSDGSSRSPDRIVYETALRYLIEERHPPGDEAICISIKGVEEQEASSVAETVVGGRTFYAGGQCRLDPPGVGVIRHLPSGRKAVLYELSSPDWLDERTAVLGGSWYSASLYGESCAYRVEKTSGVWRVVPVQDCIVS